jgi:hypothetical protein
MLLSSLYSDVALGQPEPADADPCVRWCGIREGDRPGEQIAPHDQRLPKSNHDHRRFGRAAIRN